MKKNYYYIICQYTTAKVVAQLVYTYEGEFDFDQFNEQVIDIAVEQIRKYVNPNAKKQQIIAIPSLVHQS